jgi:hypothetical protein
MNLARRRLAVCLSTLLTLLAGVVTAGVVSAGPAAAADTTAPRVVGVSFSASSVAVRGLAVARVNVDVHLTDESGVVPTRANESDYPIIHLSRVAGGAWLDTPRLSLVSGTATDGVWRAAVNVPSTWNGRWQVTLVAAYDAESNYLEVDPRTQGIAPDLTVTGTHRPAMSFGLVPQLVVGNGPVTMKGRAYFLDTGAGIANLPLASGADNSCAEGVPVNDLRTDARGYYTKTFPSGAPILFCVRLLGPAAPGHGPTIITYRSGAVRLQYVITAAPARTPVPVGTNVAVNGQLAPPAGEPVGLQRLVGGAWRTVSTAYVRTSGRFTLVATPPTRGNHRYRAYKAAGTAQYIGDVTPVFLIGAY